MAEKQDFTSMEDVKHHNMVIVERVEDDGAADYMAAETVYIVNGQVDADNPFVVEVKLTRVLHGQENYSSDYNYLQTLLEDMIHDTDSNMAVTVTEEEAVKTVEEWKVQS